LKRSAQQSVCSAPVLKRSATKKGVRRAGEMFPKDQKPEDGIQSGSVFRLLMKQSRSLTIEY
jgi:hypothetical protein